MEPQLWIAIILVSILAIFKLMLIMFSGWYEEWHVLNGGGAYDENGKYIVFVGSMLISRELIIYGVVLLVNLFAIYGLNCTLKGGCKAYSYVIIAVLILALLMHMLFSITLYKSYAHCSKGNCAFSLN